MMKLNSLHTTRLWVVMALLLVMLSGCSRIGVRVPLFGASNALLNFYAPFVNSQDDELVNLLNDANLAHLQGEYALSNGFFEQAKVLIAKRNKPSVTDQSASLIVNDTVKDYVADDYERMLLHVYSALNYIALDDLDGARVEMRQLDLLLQADDIDASVEPFSLYFSGMVYELLAEQDAALVSYRMALEGYGDENVPELLIRDYLRLLSIQGLTSELDRAVKRFPDTDIDYLQPDEGELLVLIPQGIVAQKRARSISVLAGDLDRFVRISVPALRSQKTEPRLVAQVNGRDYPLDVVDFVDQRAQAALDDALPGITARSIARAVVKYQASDAVENKSGQTAGLISSFLFNLFEQADTRSWNTLAQTFSLARIPLSEGKYHLQLRSPANKSMRVVNIRAGERQLISQTWSSSQLYSH